MKANFCLVLLLILFGQSSYAEEIIFNFGGEIHNHGSLSSDLHTLIPIGQTFSGSFTFDTTTPGAIENGDPADLSYLDAVIQFTVNFGPLYLTLDNGHMRVRDDWYPIPDDPDEPPYDSYTVVRSNASWITPPANVDTNIALSNYVSSSIDSGWHLELMRLELIDYLGTTLLGSTAIPVVPPDITGVTTRFILEFQLDCCTGRTTVQGRLTSLVVAETDGDGVRDSVDNCPTVPNPDQINSDGAADGGDACDDDDDNDDWFDVDDNCPIVANPNQEDTNQDDVGDACDPDSDGMPSDADNCPLIPNPNQEPSALEPGRGLACEGLPLGC